jgi:hypothetical protein
MERWSALRRWINRDDGRFYRIGNEPINPWASAGGLAIIAAFALLGLLTSPPALPRTTLFTSLGAELRRADGVYVARIQGGECVEPECAESAPHLTRYRYSLRCLESLLGQCNDRAPLVSSSLLKVGQTYVFITRKVGDGQRIFPIEMQGRPAPETKLLYDGGYHADGVSVHDDPGQLNSRLIYFTYADFRRTLRSARAPTSANP